MSKILFTVKQKSQLEALAGVRKVAIRPSFSMKRGVDYRRNPKHKGKGWE